MKKLILILCLLSSNVYAGLLFTYTQLKLKELDQMNKIIKEKIRESEKDSTDPVVPLKEALQAVYSRPNEDNLIEKVITPLQSELEQHDAWEHTMSSLVDEAIGALKNPKAFKANVQVTYIFFLHNVISEMKPDVRKDFARKIIQKISDSEVEISSKARDELALQLMKVSGSPSEVAEAILDADKKKQEEEKKSEKK